MLLEATASVATSLVLARLALHFDIVASLIDDISCTLSCGSSFHLGICCVPFSLLCWWFLLELCDGQPFLNRLPL